MLSPFQARRSVEAAAAQREEALGFIVVLNAFTLEATFHQLAEALQQHLSRQHATRRQATSRRRATNAGLYSFTKESLRLPRLSHTPNWPFSHQASEKNRDKN